MKPLYFTLTGTNYYYGTEFLEKDMKVMLEKEPDNKYDQEAIIVKVEGLGKIGYVANSPYTIQGESVSAGRLYDKIGDTAFGKVVYILPKGVVCMIDLEKKEEPKEEPKEELKASLEEENKVTEFEGLLLGGRYQDSPLVESEDTTSYEDGSEPKFQKKGFLQDAFQLIREIGGLSNLWNLEEKLELQEEDLGFVLS